MDFRKSKTIADNLKVLVIGLRALNVCFLLKSTELSACVFLRSLHRYTYTWDFPSPKHLVKPLEYTLVRDWFRLFNVCRL